MEENVKILSKKCKNKKVVFYCIGKFFEEALNKVNLFDCFDIQALCDIRFENKANYLNFKAILPSELKNIDFDNLIIFSPDFKSKEKFLKENNFLPKKVKVLSFFQKKEKINVQKNYKKVLKNLKTKEKLKILFICEENQKWCYTDLYKTLEHNNKFELLPVVLFPVISKGKVVYTQNENKIFFEKLNIKSFDFWNWETNEPKNIEELKPDIVFYQQPWYLNNRNNPKQVSNFALTIMAPYGYTTLSEKEWGSESVKEVYRNLWLFLAESPYHVKFYKKTAKMKNNIQVFGSLKLDSYKKEIEKNIWKKPQNPKIIYAPHHSIGLNGLKMSTFDKYYLKFFNFAKENQNYSFVFKPHPMLKQAVVEQELMTQNGYLEYLKKWELLENSKVHTEGDYFDVFKTSDILITDCSSFLAEYFPSKKPIILLNRKDRAPFDKFGKKLKKGFYIVNDFKEIEPLLKNILENKIDPLQKIRESILKNEFYIDNISAKDKLIELLLSIN